MSVPEDEFERILIAALDEADGIKCSLPEYVLNLRSWQDRIAWRIRNAETDIRRGGHDPDADAR